MGGGGQWRSARTDRSIRNYAKDVKNKYATAVDEARKLSAVRAPRISDRAAEEPSSVFSVSSRTPPPVPQRSFAQHVAAQAKPSEGSESVGLMAAVAHLGSVEG